jgi:hypothetical protein
MKAMRVALIAVISIVASFPAGAQPKPMVKVSLLVQAPAYRSHYKVSEQARIEAEGAAELARQASEYFGFLTFSPAAGSHQLAFVIANTNRTSTSRGSEVSIFVDFTSADGDRRSLRWRPLRSIGGAGTSPGSVDYLLNLIRRVGEETPWTTIERLLIDVPITDRASLEAPPVRWILQYTGRDLCIGRGSLVQVSVTLRVPGIADPMESEYTAQIVSWRPASPAGNGRIVIQPLETNSLMSELTKAATVGGVTPMAIRVREYRRDSAVCRPLQRSSPSR